MDKTHLIGPKLKILNNLTEKNLNNTAKKYFPELTGTQIAILDYISSHPKITQRELEKVFFISHPTLRRIILSLTQKGYIQNRRDSKDKRQVVLSLDEKGKQFITNNQVKMNESLLQTEKMITHSLSEEEIKQFNELLKKAIINFPQE